MAGQQYLAAGLTGLEQLMGPARIVQTQHEGIALDNVISAAAARSRNKSPAFVLSDAEIARINGARC